MDLNKLCLKCMRETVENAQCTSCRTLSGFVQEPVFALPISTILHGRYLIGAVLGHGGFGMTYMAYDLRANQRVAIKEYMPDGLSTRVPGTTEMTIHTSQEDYYYGLNKFLDEARMIHRYRENPHIITVQALFEENRTAYYVMDYLDGCDLKRYVAQKGGKLPYRQVMNLLSPIFDALGEVHRQNVIHRDISPDNIYICQNGQAKLLDFGAARVALKGKSQSLSVILKRGYAPEEQYRSHGIQGPFTDVYALAGTLYNCITGAIPPEATQRMYHDDLVPPSVLCPELPQSIDRAIVKALSVKAEDRYQTMEEFKQALQGMAVNPQPTGGLSPLNQPLKEIQSSPVNLAKSSIGRRLGALLVDSVLLCILFYGLLMPLLELETLGDYSIVLFIVSVLYSTLFEASKLKATLGKRLLGLMVSDVNGQSMSFGKLLLRNAVKFSSSLLSVWVSVQLSGIIGVVNGIILLTNKNHRAGHDLLAQTLVVEGRPTAVPQQANAPMVQERVPVYDRVDSNAGKLGLLGVSGYYKDVFFPISEGKVVLGRDPQYCHIIFPDDARGVSRVHCEVSRDTRSLAIMIKDLGSTNGTFGIDGKQITGEPRALASGETFTIGENNTFRVKVS